VKRDSEIGLQSKFVLQELTNKGIIYNKVSRVTPKLNKIKVSVHEI
jgi:hypothetical protein